MLAHFSWLYDLIGAVLDVIRISDGFIERVLNSIRGVNQAPSDARPAVEARGPNCPGNTGNPGSHRPPIDGRFMS